MKVYLVGRNIHRASTSLFHLNPALNTSPRHRLDISGQHATKESAVRDKGGSKVKTYVFRVVVEPDDDRWVAYSPARKELGGATFLNLIPSSMRK